MSILLSLQSKKCGEIKRFLQKYYGKEMMMEQDIGKWMYVYQKPLDCVDMMSALIDNNLAYEIAVCIQLNEGEVHAVNVENYNDIIKSLFNLFYQEPKRFALCE